MRHGQPSICDIIDSCDNMIFVSEISATNLHSITWSSCNDMFIPKDSNINNLYCTCDASGACGQ